ncbi:cupredoxin domain-containing protein [Ferrovibrio xuzhouensis]|uniref:Plastocyanin/azurin family copper-binding protein n=1 Tax=Ferrovibrio xuzhouensis TaxID=1576914 RepID=A0ABV7VA84_9PROT
MSRRRLVAAGAIVAGLLLAGPVAAHGPEPHGGAPTGQPGRPGTPARVVRIEMAEPMRFIPDRITVRRGETVRFVFSNSDYRDHEFVIGDMAALQAHAEQMRRHPGMMHREVNAVTVSPWNEGELLWHFTRPGQVDFACLIPGHFEGGMRGVVIVE